MKTKIKRHSRSVLSVILAICILISCMVAGLIATDAAKSADQRVGAQDDNSDGVGATEYLILSYNSNNITSGATYVTSDSKTFTLTASDFGQSSFETGKNYYVGYSSSSSYTGISNGGTSAGIGTKDSGISGLFVQDYSGYKFVGFSLASTSVQSVTVTVSGDAPYTYSMTSSTSGGGGGGESGGGSGETGTSVTDNDLIAVLKGTKIMIYYGDEWGSGTKYAKTSTSGASNISATSSLSGKYNGSSNTQYLAYGAVTAGATYSVSNTSNWDGVSIGTPTAGYMYALYSSNNNNYYWTNSKAPTITWSTSSDTITEGDGTSSIAATSSGSTGIDASTSVKYFYTTDNTNFYTFDPSDTGDLDAGTYTIIATAYDGNIYVKASSNGTLAIDEPEVTHAVTFTASPTAGGSISPASGTAVGEETATQIEATPSAGYEFSSWTFGTGITGASTSTNPTTITTESSGDYTVTANFTAKPTHTITVNTNNPAYGTASASVASAYQGQEVTLTATESTGTFSNWTVNSGSVTVSGNTKSATFTMGSSDVSITANFTEYTTASPFYYNSYGSNGQPAATHYGAQMTEAKISGETFSYYHVQGRDENDQLFTVSYGSPEYNSYNTYFEIFSDWEAGKGIKVQFYTTDGNNLGDYVDMTYDTEANGKKKFKYPIPDGAREIQFKHGDDTTGKLSLYSGNNAWYTNNSTGSFSDVTGYASSNPVPTNFYENFNGTNKYTDAFTTGGFYSHYASRGQSHAYTKPKGLDSSTKGDYYIVVLYKNKTYTINGVTKTISNDPEIIWMSELPGQTPADNPTVKVYAKDGAIRRDGDKPERNDRTYSSFEQYANTFVYSDSGYATHIGVRSSHDGQSSEGSTGYNGYTYDYVNKFNKGDTLYIKTVLKDDTFMNKYYLAAYSINGKTYALHTTAESDTRTVTEAFTVPEDWEDKYVEITPIYFLRDSAGINTITFYIEGYDETVMNAGWGNTPFVYPFYQDANFNYVSNINNAFGGYPGQPMVFYKGNYYIQLPKEITTTISTGQTGTATIKGVTLGNGYWDDIHILTGEVSSHFQTYDYDDLYKIYNEKSNADHIICAFKYRTKKNNDEPASMSSSIAANYNTTNGNGWEVLTNYYGEPVDVFGNVLTGTAKTLAENIMAGTASAESSAVVHAISQDYKSNSAGDYATEWVIYNTSGTKVVASSGGKTSIVPSALAINANTTGTGELTANFDKYDNATKAFKSIYTALYNDSNVLNKPAVVTYEKSIYGGGDKADRCDARWYFSQKDAPITATTRIEYTDDGKTWNTDTYTSGTGTGSTTGTKAYFTGKASTATDTPSTTTGIDDTNTTTYSGNVGQGYYTIKAENAGQYQFVGWYLLRDNYQNISTRSSYAADATEFPSHAEMSKNGDIFVARFKKTATGTFDIYHEIHPQTTGYGTVTVSAIVKDSNGDPISGASYPASGTTNHVTIPNTYIRSGEGNTIVATFTATPYHTSNFDAFYATVQDLLQDFEGYDYIDSISISGGTATVTYNVDKMFSMASGSPVQTVTNVTHYSKFSLKDNLTYSLEYTFNTRYYGTKLYKYTDVAFTEQELRSYFLDQITAPNCDHIKLDKQFVKAKAPFESNFREDLTWVVDDVTFNNDNDPTIGYLTATQVKTKWATAMVYDFDNNGEMRTTTMVAPIEKLFNASTNTKPTYPSTEAEATAISAWSVTNDQMYHPYRTSYVPAGETSSAPLYIDHWDIYQLDSFTYKTVNNSPKMMEDGYNLDVDLSKSVLVAQAYSSRFNYVGYEDYVVVPVYNKDYVDRQGASDNRTDSSATLLTITRNQWNFNADGNTDASKYKDSADRVYVDFMLNYNYSVKINGKDTNILLNSTGDNIQVGFIVRSYTWENEQKSYGNAQYVLVDKAQINDKNRIEYCFGFNNTANNRRAGLYYEFKPFIVDTSNQAGSAGCDVTIDNTPYKALYADSTVSVLDQVSFYQLGRL